MAIQCGEDAFCEADLKERAGWTVIPSPKTYNISGMGFHMDAEFTQDPVTGHVTLTCHCARCKGERERNRAKAEADCKEWGGYITDCLEEVEGSEAGNAFCEEMKRLKAENND